MTNRDAEFNEKQEDLQAELVAYLDDELDDVRRHEIDELLAHVPAVREKVASLGRAWDALDHLPRSEVDESFTKSTVEMIAVQAASDVHEQEAAAPRRRRRRWAALLATTATALVLGFAAVAALWPRPNDRLVDDLAVIENLDVYAQTPNIEFVRRLAESDLFADDLEDGATFEPPVDTTERRALIERMEPAQKSQLVKKWERFGRLDEAEQERLRELHAALTADAASKSLRSTLYSYSQWLGELTAIDRFELDKLGVNERLARVEELRGEDAKRFAPGDMPRFRQWLEDFVTAHRQALLDNLPRDARRHFEGRGSENRRQAILLTFQFVFNKKSRAIIEPADVEQLRQALSDKGQKKLAAVGDLDNQRELIAGWVEAVFHDLRKQESYQVSQQELTDFLEQLPDKDELLRLPANDMLERLRGMYFHEKRDEQQGRRSNGDQRGFRSRSRDDDRPQARQG